MNAPIDATLQNLYDWIDKQRERVIAKKGDLILYRIPEGGWLGNTQWLVPVACVIHEQQEYGVYPYYDGNICQDLVPFDQAVIFPDRDGLALTTPEE